MSKLLHAALPGVLLALCMSAAHAQSSCSSDGQPRPTGILERFISADCQACWSDRRVARPAAGELALDWIVPGTRGDDAPLSSAASRDALARLGELKRPVTKQSDTSTRKVQAAADRQLRVAHGPAFNGYVGTSMELKPGSGGPWKAWLLLVETLPAGTEGSPVVRNLVRNAFQATWKGKPPSKQEQQRLLESRAMSIPEGVGWRRLSVVGWVEDPRGRIRAIAQSHCVPEGN